MRVAYATALTETPELVLPASPLLPSGALTLS